MQGCPTHVLAAVDELVYGHHAVFVLIHLLSERKQGVSMGDLRGLFHCIGCRWLTCLEKHFNVLARSLLFKDGVCAFPHHVVDGLHDVQHFLGGKGDEMELASRCWQNQSWFC